MKRNKTVLGLIALSSVLFVLAGGFCALFLLNTPNSNDRDCLAAARAFAKIAQGSYDDTEESGALSLAVVAKVCQTGRPTQTDQS